VEAAIGRATELAQLEPTEVRCVKYEEAPTLFGELMGAESVVPASGRIDLSALIDLMTPRAYYLWTSLPALMRNSR